MSSKKKRFSAVLEMYRVYVFVWVVSLCDGMVVVVGKTQEAKAASCVREGGGQATDEVRSAGFVYAEEEDEQITWFPCAECCGEIIFPKLLLLLVTGGEIALCALLAEFFFADCKIPNL